MTGDVKAMIEKTVQELKGSWQEAGGRRQERQRQSPRQFSPQMNADCADLENQEAGGRRQELGKANQEAEARGAEEALEAACQTLKEQVKAELLDRIKAASPTFFERLVVELMVRLGYGGAGQNAGTVTGQSGDEGIDGVIQQDRLGLELVYVQAKRWKHEVARPEIQKFVGALHGKRASRGVFVTTSSFGKGAVEFAAGLEGKKVVLIDGERLTELMFESGLGLVTAGTYELKRVDPEYFHTISNREGHEGAQRKDDCVKDDCVKDDCVKNDL